MNNTKFTPGPWVTVKAGHDKTLIRQALDCSGIEAGYIGEVYCSRPARYKPNTALIAAAPELYRELENLLLMVIRQRDFDDYGNGGQIQRCEDALLKAKGETE